MNREFNKSKLAIMSISAALAVSIFALFSLNGSVAWFAGNTDVEANGLNIKVSSPESSVESVEYFKIEKTALLPLADGADPNTADRNEYSFSTISDEDSSTLGTYSIINDKMQVLMKITFKDGTSFDRIKVTASSEQENASSVIPAREGPYGISTVISFSLYNGGDIAIRQEDGVNYYVVKGSDCVESGSFSTPPSEAGGEPAFTNEIEFNAPVSIQPPEDADESEKKTMYIVLDYQREVAQYIKEQVELDDDKSGWFEENENGEKVLLFTVCDFSLEITAS